MEWTLWEKSGLLLLLIAANGAPILLDNALGARFRYPLDGGRVWRDGRRLLGSSATLRGLAGAVLGTAALAPLLGQSPRLGALIGLLAMLGDALSSFVKRRLGLAPGDRATGLDQIPEALLPLLAVAEPCGLTGLEIALLVASFLLLDMVGSRLLYRLHLRRQPH